MKISKQYILDRVKVDGNGCWIWQLAKDRDGYGQAKINKKKWRAHRVSYEAFIGKIPEDECVLHHCDVPSCVNPNHLFSGTHQDNMDDCKNKGRLNKAKGTKQGHSKLTESEVLQIRSDRRTFNAIGKAFGVSRRCVYDIKHRLTWTWLT